MPFFQNPFTADFEGNLVLGDRQYVQKFVIKGHTGRGDENVTSWTAGPYDFSGNDAAGNATSTLRIVYALHNTKNWGTMSVTVTTGAASSAAVTEAEVVSSLNADTLFAERFVATVSNGSVMIRQRKPKTEFKFYIENGRAEEKLGFNKRAGVAELPSYFARHTIANRFTYTDSQGHLVQLSAANAVDAAIINNAVDYKGVSLGYSSSTVHDDWQLLAGKSGLFQFTKGPSANAVSTTETVITYHAGAVAGDLGTKTVTQKDAGGLVVKQFVLPYTLTSGDLVTPP